LKELYFVSDCIKQWNNEKWWNLQYNADEKKQYSVISW